MISHWLVTGDTHGQFGRFAHIDRTPDTAVIILGDVGLNYNLNENDYAAKKGLCRNHPFTFYCVRGNHEARPGDVSGMELVYDEDVCGEVWMEPQFPRIRYFKDWGIYTINGLRTLVIGGAYSVDKHYRLAQGWRWFKNEQLSKDEMVNCQVATRGKVFDLVLSHTCPLSFQPTDLFLRGLDQSTVDNSMEIWLDKMTSNFCWEIWLFGHYHADRVELPKVEQFYYEIETLDDVVDRWKRYDETGEIDWWLPKSSNFNKLFKEK